MKSRHKYLCLILPFVLLFTTAFAQQPTAPTDGQDTAQIAEQHQPDITVQPEATPGVALEVMPEQTPNQTAQPEKMDSGRHPTTYRGTRRRRKNRRKRILLCRLKQLRLQQAMDTPYYW